MVCARMHWSWGDYLATPISVRNELVAMMAREVEEAQKRAEARNGPTGQHHVIEM